MNDQKQAASNQKSSKIPQERWVTGHEFLAKLKARKRIQSRIPPTEMEFMAAT